MHYLKSLSVKNYRSIKEEAFPFHAFTGLIGYNNAGKSSVLAACKWLLKRTTLTDSDFNVREQAVEVSGQIVGITDALLNKLEGKHAASLRPYVHEESLTIKRVQAAPGGRVSDIKLYVLNPNPVDGEDPWKDNPGGLDVAIDKIFPDPIEIGALDNIEEDVAKNKSTTTIGRLIAEIMAPVRERFGAAAQEALSSLTDVIDADGASRAKELKEFDENSTNKIKELFPDVSIRLHIPTPDLSDIFKAGTIKIYEEGYVEGRDIKSLGSGTQRAVQMALIRQLAENKREQDETPTCTLLLIDEPELYLHPHAIEQTRVALKQLSGLGYQVIFATHSAQMVKSTDAMNAILLRKNIERGSYRRKTIKDAISEIISGENHLSQLGMIFSLTNSTQILFADTVILVEGATESRLIPELFEHHNGGQTLGCFKCALVAQGGGNSTAKSKEVLEALDLPVKVVADMDYAFGQGIRKGWIDQESDEVKVCLSYFKELAKKGEIKLGKNERPDKRWTRIGFNMLYENEVTRKAVTTIHEILLKKGIWVWKRGVIESHLGLADKDQKTWAGLVDKVKKEGLKSVASDDLEIIRMLDWLKASG